MTERRKQFTLGDKKRTTPTAVQDFFDHLTFGEGLRFVLEYYDNEEVKPDRTVRTILYRVKTG